MESQYSNKLGYSDLNKYRLLAHRVGGGNPEAKIIISWLGHAPYAISLRKEPKDIGKIRESDHPIILAALTEALWITSDNQNQLGNIQEELIARIRWLVSNGSWRIQDSTNLVKIRSKSVIYIDSSIVTVIDSALYNIWLKNKLAVVAGIITGHATFWLLLLTIYPKSKSVQALFFWNPWVRRIGGLGYVGFALAWIPLLRKQLFSPFTDNLLCNAANSDSMTDTYYPNCYVTSKQTHQRGVIINSIPNIQGQIILEGESGLGKSMFLRQLVQHSKRLTVYLQASHCKTGVLDAIQYRLHGIAKDTDYLQTLIYSGALDVCIDGLNEVSPETRAVISLFVEKYKGNIIIGTQPIEWVPPNSAIVYMLEPLEQNQIEEFLLSRKADLQKESNNGHSDYNEVIHRYVNSVFNERNDKELIETSQRILTNPMDLTVVANMLYQGKQPDLFHLLEQHYKSMADYFKSRNNGRDFPVALFSDQAYDMRLRDKWRIPGNDFIPELECMERYKMVLTRQYDDEEGKTSKVWYFRHDKIWDYFIVQALSGKSNHRIEQHIKDVRFRGVYFLLATFLMIEDAKKLREKLINYAADTKDHTISDRFIQILRSRDIESLKNA